MCFAASMKAMHMLKFGAGQHQRLQVAASAIANGSVASLPGSHPSRRKFSSTVSPEASKLTFADLYQASTLSRWCGLCYKPADAIPALVQAEGLEFVAQGRTGATSWIIADGCIDFEPFVEGMLSTMNLPPSQAALCRESFQKTVQRTISATQSASRNDNNRWSMSPKPLPHQHSGSELLSKSNGASHTQHPAKPAGSAGSPCPHPSGQSLGPWCLPPQRFIFVRGVQWSAVETGTEFVQLSSALSNFLPTPFAGPPGSNPEEALLVAHGGVSWIASDLYSQLLPYLSHELPLPPKPLQLRHQRLQQQWLDTAHTFGSPPVMAHKDGGGGYKVLQRVPVRYCRMVLIIRVVACFGIGISKLVFKMHVGFEGILKIGEIGIPKCQVLGLPDTAICSFVHQHATNEMADRFVKGSVLGLPDGAIRSFVQQHDPIPRVLLTADPTYHAMVRFIPGMQQLLQLRGWLLGGAPGSMAGDAADARGTAAVLTPSRFMFENVGSIYLIKGGPEITPIGSPSDMDDWALTQISAGEFLAAYPAKALRCHQHHQSFQSQCQSQSQCQHHQCQSQCHQSQCHQSHPTSANSANSPTSPTSATSPSSANSPTSPSMISVEICVFIKRCIVVDVVKEIIILITIIINVISEFDLGWMDHHHGSYQHDLDIAAMVELKREARSVLRYWQAREPPVL
ncbi:hypothetical protein DUNSADRAFT_988 [Dunaliella salina]|uniref:Uncharacterized protein n=1 Tax=Dunaliella salina TaxID=3046 RepID=A0ABQ7FY55_DUNSA|nr:hypothetical protein DUNSADRAFT_988 [Dunaliella salina]|eukprot:KAF5827295.1 hypothetical protein DUNSADRAFT_988 [Dunaliella salina]